jgi:hypothetical protein
MAENEYLDSTKSRRWLAVADGLREGCDLDELTERIGVKFHKSFRELGQEIPLDVLIANINNPVKLEEVCHSFEGASDVKSLLLEATQNCNSPVTALQQFLRDALQRILYDIPWIASERSGHSNVSDDRRRLDEARMRLEPDLRRMAEKWAENPSWKPVRQRKGPATAQAKVDVTRSMLSESLIAGFRK